MLSADEALGVAIALVPPALELADATGFRGGEITAGLEGEVVGSLAGVCSSGGVTETEAVRELGTEALGFSSGDLVRAATAAARASWEFITPD